MTDDNISDVVGFKQREDYSRSGSSLDKIFGIREEYNIPQGLSAVYKKLYKKYIIENFKNRANSISERSRDQVIKLPNYLDMCKQYENEFKIALDIINKKQYSHLNYVGLVYSLIYYRYLLNINIRGSEDRLRYYAVESYQYARMSIVDIYRYLLFNISKNLLLSSSFLA